jgi:NADPH:quinone reductase-like Zn-dependent oxidoreductase
MSDLAKGFMEGVVLTGHGGLDKLEYRDKLPLPVPAENEVLVKVHAAGVNNTDINTRIGWYSKTVTGDTNQVAEDGLKDNADDGSWSGEPLKFPLIQGADCCGEIIAVGSGVNTSRIGERILIRPMQQNLNQNGELKSITMGSECNGSFAQYTKALAHECYPVNSSLSSTELASFPCAYSTAENMIDRVQVNETDTVLITGASGGVGSAAIQLAKRRGAKVIAVCAKSKAESVLAVGADKVLAREESILLHQAHESVDVVIDLVAGDSWSELIDVLKVRGRYAVAGAIAGPIVEMDVRTLYLKDLTYYGCTFQPSSVFENLVRYINDGEIKPLVSKVYELKQIKEAQTDFLNKTYMGKLVLSVSK